MFLRWQKTLWLVLIIIIAEISVITFNIPSYILPPPSKILYILWVNKIVYINSAIITLFEAITGLVLAIIITAIIAFLSAIYQKFDDCLIPLLIALQCIPVLAIAPLLTIWFGHGYGAKIAATVVVCFFPLLSGWLNGFASVKKDEKELFYTFGANKWATFRWLTIYRALPFFFSGLKVSAPLSLLGAMVGEFVGSSSGLGFLMLSSSYYLRTDEMFGSIILVSILGFSLHGIVSYIQRKIVFWNK